MPGAGAAATAVLRGFEILPRRDRIRGFMGYPPDSRIPPEVSARIDAEIERSLPLVRPAAAYRVFQVASLSPRSIEIDVGIKFHGEIGEFLGEIDRLAVFIATAGHEVYRRAQEEIQAGRPLEGLVANAVGSEGAECAAEAAEARIREAALQEGRAITLRYSPGYCGMDVREQRGIFEALDGSAIGVELLPSFIMSPIKSVSGIIGIGGPSAIVAAGSPCERCERRDCMMRRYA